MRRGWRFLVCLVFISTVGIAATAQSPAPESAAGESRAAYQQLSEQALAVMREPITVPEPPSTAVSCAEEGKAERDSQSLTAFQDAFNHPEGTLCAQMLAVQKELQLLGAEPDYAREAALMDRLGQKALTLVEEYGGDIEKVPAIAMVGIQTAANIQLLGLDDAGRSAALLNALSSMYENAMEELFRRLVEEHDYGVVQPILDAARASLLLSADSGIDTDDILSRLRNAMRFELTLTYNFEQTGNHRWLVQALIDMQAAFALNDEGRITGSGTGSLLSFSWDDNPGLTVSAPDFPVEAVFTRFDPCGAGAALLLTPFHPLSEIAQQEGESMEWPLLRLSWETAFPEHLQADGLYLFPLTLRNLDSTAVSEKVEYSVPSNEVSLEVLLVHKPEK